MLELTCATKCSILHLHPQLLSQDSQHFTLTLAVLPGAIVLHLERGTAVVQHYRTWAMALPRLKWPLGLGVLIPFPLPPQHLSSLSHSFSSSKNRRVPFSLSSIGDLELPSILPWFPHQSLREKVPNSIREQILWFPYSKEHLVHGLAGGCVYYSWSLAPSG